MRNISKILSLLHCGAEWDFAWDSAPLYWYEYTNYRCLSKRKWNWRKVTSGNVLLFSAQILFTPNIKMFKTKKSLLVTYIPSYVPNTIIFLSHSCSCLFHLLPSLHVKFCSLLRVTNIACVTINIIPTKLCHTIVSQLLKICCE